MFTYILGSSNLEPRGGVFSFLKAPRPLLVKPDYSQPPRKKPPITISIRKNSWEKTWKIRGRAYVGAGRASGEMMDSFSGVHG